VLLFGVAHARLDWEAQAQIAVERARSSTKS
jgi:hypothetical protein